MKLDHLQFIIGHISASYCHLTHTFDKYVILNNFISTANHFRESYDKFGEPNKNTDFLRMKHLNKSIFYLIYVRIKCPFFRTNNRYNCKSSSSAKIKHTSLLHFQNCRIFKCCQPSGTGTGSWSATAECRMQISLNLVLTFKIRIEQFLFNSILYSSASVVSCMTLYKIIIITVTIVVT